MPGRAMRAAALMLWLAAWAQGGWRTAAYLGGAANHPGDVIIHQPERATNLRFHRVSFETQAFRPAVYYGYRLGYFFGRIGLEAEFIHHKIYARTGRTVRIEGTLRGQRLDAALPMHSVAPQFSISHGLNMLLANVVLERRLGRRAYLNMRLGAGPTIPHPESNILGESRQQYQLGRPAVQVAAGLEFRLWRGLHWLTEYKFTRTRQRVDVVAGTGETLVRTHHGVFGIGLRL